MEAQVTGPCLDEVTGVMRAGLRTGPKVPGVVALWVCWVAVSWVGWRTEQMTGCWAGDVVTSRAIF